LMLARALSLPSNLLVLDEPTNDLDLETLDLLQEMIGDYPGTVILVSHDRDFLDRTVDAVIASDGDGRWTVYAGGYSDMLTQRGEAPAPEPSAKSKTPKPQATERPKAKTKLSFAENHALKTLPTRIAALQSEIATLQESLADADLYARDPKKFQASSTRVAAAQAELDAAENQWLELEMLREEIGG